MPTGSQYKFPELGAYHINEVIGFGSGRCPFCKKYFASLFRHTKCNLKRDKYMIRHPEIFQNVIIPKKALQ